MNKQKAYTIVLNDLVECKLFCGVYDAQHGSEAFMHGINTVMEVIAHGANPAMVEAFNAIFNANIIESKKKVEK